MWKWIIPDLLYQADEDGNQGLDYSEFVNVWNSIREDIEVCYILVWLFNTLLSRTILHLQTYILTYLNTWILVVILACFAFAYSHICMHAYLHLCLCKKEIILDQRLVQRKSQKLFWIDTFTTFPPFNTSLVKFAH